MKLRWIDSKSKRLQEVFIDLNAILTGPTAGTQRPGSPLAPLLPIPAMLGEEEIAHSTWRTALDARPHLD